MDLPFPIIDPLEDTFDESEDVKSEKTDLKDEEFLTNDDEKSDFSSQSLIVVKTELDDSFLSDGLESSQSSNSNDKSIAYLPFKVSTIISESKYIIKYYNYI